LPLFSKKDTTETSYSKGVHGEKIAEDYLREKGFSILKTRYKTKFGEIDIIAKRSDLICFVEVKIRKNQADALESVTPKIQRRIENAALFFLSENPECAQCDLRFDVIAISGDAKISHLDNAWQART
tara:strand:+ start:229 stop:609 length:381 start_codon:yes stop_codon:yes gene_type:complete